MLLNQVEHAQLFTLTVSGQPNQVCIDVAEFLVTSSIYPPTVGVTHKVNRSMSPDTNNTHWHCQNIFHRKYFKLILFLHVNLLTDKLLTQDR